MNRLLLIALYLLAIPAHATEQWELVKDEAGIKVYTRFVLNSDYKMFKAEVFVDADMGKITTVLKNVAEYKTWFSYTKSTRVLEDSPNRKVLYMETDFPWPFHTGDMVYEISFPDILNRDVKIHLKGVPGYLPQREGITRIHKATGYIEIKDSGEKAKIIFSMHSEPSGNIPAWIANKFIYNMPYKTLKNLRGILMRHG